MLHGMHDCVISTTSRTVRPSTYNLQWKAKSVREANTRKPRVPHHRHTPLLQIHSYNRLEPRKRRADVLRPVLTWREWPRCIPSFHDHARHELRHAHDRGLSRLDLHAARVFAPVWILIQFEAQQCLQLSPTLLLALAYAPRLRSPRFCVKKPRPDRFFIRLAQLSGLARRSLSLVRSSANA